MLVKELNINTEAVYVNLVNGEETITFDSTKDEIIEKYGDNEVIEYYPWEGEEDESEKEVEKVSKKGKKKDNRKKSIVIIKV